MAIQPFEILLLGENCYYIWPVTLLEEISYETGEAGKIKGITHLCILRYKRSIQDTLDDLFLNGV